MACPTKSSRSRGRWRLAACARSASSPAAAAVLRRRHSSCPQIPGRLKAPDGLRPMRSSRRLSVLLLIACACVALVGCADEKRAANGDKSSSGWRPLPLVKGGKVDPAWTQVGWGGFVVEDDLLKTAPDERGLGMLLYTKERFGDCQIRVVFKPTKPQANSGVFIRLDDGMLQHTGEKAFPAKRDPAGKLSEESMKGMQEA